MKNYITIHRNEKIDVSITEEVVANLKAHKPKGCLFYNYSMWDLLKDWIAMYSWQMPMNTPIRIEEFVKAIDGDGKVSLYGEDMIYLLTL